MGDARSREHARPARRGLGAWSRTWLLLLAASLVTTGVVEAALLEFGQGYFSGGFNGVYLDSLSRIAGFFAAGVLLDLALVLGLWTLSVPVLRRLLGGRLRTAALAGMCGLVVPLAFDFGKYKLHTVVGDFVGFGLFWDVAQRDVSTIVSEALPAMGPMVFVVPAVLVGGVLTIVIAGRLERTGALRAVDLEPPGVRVLGAGFAVAALLSVPLLAGSLAFAPRVHHGLSSKPSAVVFTSLVEQVTDVDGDGAGVFSRPRDPDPFDGAIHPYALDIPGNGVDENGLAGDHPPGFPAPSPAAPPAADEGRRPHVLLVFLESFRGDLLDRRYGDREITPFLNRLAREGAHSDRAYVHSPFTVASRAQLFGGRLDPHHGQRTLIDDFRERGYRVALFSGQDDSFGESATLMGVDRAHRHYDARQDTERRTSRSTQKVSLQVSWKTLLERVETFLEGHDPDRPLFLYLNVVDTHFPYHHDELDNLLHIAPSDRSEISADRADRVWATYANAVANVDRAVEAAVASFRRHLGGSDHAVIVTADHGQAIFDRGFLGHGQGLTQEQTRVPFILWGVGGDWPEPLGLADVRGMLDATLFVRPGPDPPRARFVPQADRTVLQFMARLEQARLLGLRRVDQAALYDLKREELELLGRGDRPREATAEARRAEFRDLIRSWEALRLAGAEALAASGPEAAGGIAAARRATPPR